VISYGLDTPDQVTDVRRAGVPVASIRSFAESPGLEPNVSLLRAGRREIDAALLLPRDHITGQSLPVLLDPYGGPHFQRVVRAQDAFLPSQWLSDHAFAVLVAEGTVTAGRVACWDKRLL